MNATLPRVATIAVAALALAASGCGRANPETGRQVVQGSGGNVMSATDTGTVADALQRIERGCRAGAPAASFVAPARTVGTVARLRPDEVFESGTIDEAVRMRDLVPQVVSQLRSCHAPAAGRALTRQAFSRR
jgi:hypothetical protein